MLPMVSLRDSTLTLSLSWIRRIASPKRGATETTSILGEKACPYSKLNPNVLMMKSAEDWY